MDKRNLIPNVLEYLDLDGKGSGVVVTSIGEFNLVCIWLRSYGELRCHDSGSNVNAIQYSLVNGPVNETASKMVGKEIKGDAMLASG